MLQVKALTRDDIEESKCDVKTFKYNQPPPRAVRGNVGARRVIHARRHNAGRYLQAARRKANGLITTQSIGI